jgi:hypothetical protein
MRNERMSTKEWTDVISKGMVSYVGGTAGGAFKPVTYYFGKRVIYSQRSNEIILFEQCEYCGNKSLNYWDCCTTCSAPVEM